MNPCFPAVLFDMINGHFHWRRSNIYFQNIFVPFCNLWGMKMVYAHNRIVRALFSTIVIISLFFLSEPCPAASDPIRIGATVSLEGRYESLSYMVRNGYQLWVNEMNDMGGLLGRKIKLILYDDKSRADLVIDLYEKLIVEDKVDLVLSPYGSTLTMAAARVTEKHGYVLLAASASSTEIWQQGFRGVFGVYSTADRYFLGFLDLIARQGLQTVAIVYSNTTFNISAMEGAKKWASLFGLEVPFTSRYDNHKEDLPDIVNQLQQQSFDGLIFCGYPPEGYHFLQLLEQAGIKPPGLALTIIPALPDFHDNVGSFADHIFGPSQWEADERLPFPGTTSFIQQFIAKTGKKPSYQACSSYSACQILQSAIVKSGDIDHDTIRHFVANLDTVTIMGRFKVDFDGKQIGHNPIIVQWQKGNKEIVYPTKMSTAPPLFP